MLLVLVLVAAALRFLWLDQIPPGWRDDELIESLVISQKVLDGEWAFYYPDASGHEALYHVLNAAFLALFGPGAVGIRWLSAGLGVFSVALTVAVGRQLFGGHVGLLAGVGLACSFWSLMYSRIGLRHVSVLPFMLAAWAFFWLGVRGVGDACRRPRVSLLIRFALAGVSLGVGLYTYFAARGVPIVLVAMLVYWAVWDRRRWRRHVGGVLLALAVTVVMAIPLVVSVARLPAMVGRVEEVALPLTEAMQGDLTLMLHHVGQTVSMFWATGDGEWLYNLPDRPVLNPIGAAWLFAGLALCVARALKLRGERDRGECAFLVSWFVIGLVPGFLSLPPASLGHTIVAQPATYLLMAVAMDAGWRAARHRWPRWSWVVFALAVVSIATNAGRDLNDYFRVWPEKGMVRFLYRADYHDLAGYLNARPDVESVSVSSALAGPWDRQALEIDLNRAVQSRWFDPRRALLIPGQGGYVALTSFPPLAEELVPLFDSVATPVVRVRGFQLYAVQPRLLSSGGVSAATPARFANGLVLAFASAGDAHLTTAWQAETAPTGLPAFRLVSNPPPPGVDTRPRLAVFCHLLNGEGSATAVDDGLWVDPYTLQAGDSWVQIHLLGETLAGRAVALGLYDPVTELRVPLDGGQDYVLVLVGTP